ncbi:MAG: hypothetical protein AAFO04_29900 [Cyanobacteria bacterium J06592_8]
MLRSYSSWLILGILTLVGFGSSIKSAKAQTTYSFDATYDASATLLNPITEEITSQTVSGVSNNAPFGLTEASGVLYIKTDLSNNSYTFSSNPETFGLQGLPLGGVSLFGEGDNKLFYAVENGTGIIDLTNLTTTGTNTNIITGGEGLFQGATGTLTGSEVYQIGNLLVDPTSSSMGIVRVTGTIEVPLTQKVPESNSATALTGIGIIGATFLLRRRVNNSR